MTTIFAPSTPSGKSGIAVLRVSGPKSREVVEMLTKNPVPAPRMACLRKLYGDDGELLDTGLVLWFCAPKSYTGEDMAEFHVHGSLAGIKAIMETLAAYPGLRPAEAGEFTRRAVRHGKMDLMEAEGLADLLQAETEGQRLQALRQMEGDLHNLYAGWRAKLMQCLAHCEAMIDFTEEDTISDDLLTTVARDVMFVQQRIVEHLADDHRGERLREGVRVALLGPPNVGKSSFLNWLARRDAALVSAIPGTTRDAVEVALDVKGIPVVVSDTAGLRATEDSVELLGISRAYARGQEADIRLFMDTVEAARPFSYLESMKAMVRPGDMRVLNKCDMSPLLSKTYKNPGKDPDKAIVSVLEGLGLEDFYANFSQRLHQRYSLSPQPSLTRSRYRHALQEAHGFLQTAQQGIKDSMGMELVAENIRLSLRALGRVLGYTDVEDLLDIIFRDFCIGK